jgi:hypothetical protein
MVKMKEYEMRLSRPWVHLLSRYIEGGIEDNLKEPQAERLLNSPR